MILKTITIIINVTANGSILQTAEVELKNLYLLTEPFYRIYIRS